jgi:hypothetical protein
MMPLTRYRESFIHRGLSPADCDRQSTKIKGGPMQKHLSSIFWVESVVASVSAVLAVLTLVRRDWIEAVFGFDPDHRNGSFEWKLVIVLFLATCLFAALARREWYRASGGATYGS